MHARVRELPLRDFSRYIDARPADGVLRMHLDLFRDPELFELEMRYLYERSRVFVGQAAQIIDRGVLAVGKAADLVIFDPATVACGDKQWASDLPGGGRRFVTRSSGVRATIVAGEVLFENGAYRDGARPGRVLRSYEA